MTLLLSLLLACGEPPEPDAAVVPAEAPAAPADEAPDVPTHHPTPFTAAQIRGAMPVGTSWSFQQTTPGGTTTLAWEVVAADDETVTIAYTPEGGERQEQVDRFDDLVGHALFETSDTVRERAERALPWGTEAGWSYVRTTEEDGQTKVQRYFFADAHPGPPVWMSWTLGETEIMGWVKDAP